MHPDDKIVSPKAASHGPPGSARGKASGGGHKGRADRDAWDPDDEDEDMSLYANLKFPPYEYREWPKFVTHPVSGIGKACKSPAEELEYIQTNADGTVEPSPIEKERDALAREVASLRAQLDPTRQQEAKKASEVKPTMSPAGGSKPR